MFSAVLTRSSSHKLKLETSLWAFAASLTYRVGPDGSSLWPGDVLAHGLVDEPLAVDVGVVLACQRQGWHFCLFAKADTQLITQKYVCGAVLHGGWSRLLNPFAIVLRFSELFGLPDGDGGSS